MYVPLQNCPTSALRHEMERQGLDTDRKTRRHMISILRTHGVHGVEQEPVPEAEPTPVREAEPTAEPTAEPEPTRAIDYSPLSPYIPIESVRREGNLLTDASFSVLRAGIIRSVHSLQVSDLDVVKEIEDIKELKKQLVNDYITLKNNLNHLKDTLEQTLNRDLYIYQIANEIKWDQLERYVHVPHYYQVETPTFYGKVEDSVIHANMQFELRKIGLVDQRLERFTIDLPVAMDTTLPMCPIMVLVYSNFDEATGVYQSESTTCHAYIHRDAPSTLHVFCPLLLDAYERIQFDITLRYFSRLEDRMITPARMSSMWYSEILTERNHLAKHQWTIMGDRVELFTHVEMVTEMESVDTIRVRLPTEAAQFDVVGYGVIHYTIDGDPSVIYSANTPMVRISREDTHTLVIKSAILKNVHTNIYNNNIDTMKVSTHVVYSKKSDTNLVHSFVIQQPFANTGDTIHVMFQTSTPVNSYYFMDLRAVDDLGNEWFVESPIEGLQTRWHFVWTVPATIERDVEVRFVLHLYETAYTSTNSLIIPSVPLQPENIHVEVDHVGSHDIAVWILGIDTSFEIPYAIHARVGAQEEQHVYTGFTRSTSKIWFQWLVGLDADTAYTLELLFHDPLGRETVYPVNVVTKPVFIPPY
jgi:hypothetical protein